MIETMTHLYHLPDVEESYRSETELLRALRRLQQTHDLTELTVETYEGSKAQENLRAVCTAFLVWVEKEVPMD